MILTNLPFIERKQFLKIDHSIKEVVRVKRTKKNE